MKLRAVLNFLLQSPKNIQHKLLCFLVSFLQKLYQPSQDPIIPIEHGNNEINQRTSFLFHIRNK